MSEYLELIAEIRGGMYISDAHIEMYDHEIYKNEFPAHLHIDIFGEYRSKGYGSKMIEAFCNNLKEKGIKVVEVLLHVGLGTFRPVKEDDILAIVE